MSEVESKPILDVSNDNIAPCQKNSTIDAEQLTSSFNDLLSSFETDDALVCNAKIVNLYKKLKFILSELKCTAYAYIGNFEDSEPASPDIFLKHSFTLATHENTLISLPTELYPQTLEKLLDTSQIETSDNMMLEPFCVFPSSDGPRSYIENYIKNPNDSDDNSIMYKIIGVNSDADILSKRVPLDCRIYKLEELPCIIFKLQGRDHVKSSNTYPNEFETSCLRLPAPIHLIFVINNIFDDSFLESSTVSIEMGITKEQLLWFQSFVTNVINNPVVHYIRLQYYEIQKTIYMLNLDFSEDRSWSKFESSNCTVAYSMMPDSNLFCSAEGYISANAYQVLSIIHQTDYQTLWIPFCSTSRKLCQVSPVSQVVHQVNSFPWPLNCREFILVGNAVDLLDAENSRILITSPTIPDNCESFFGHKVETPMKNVVRATLNFMAFCIEIDKNNQNKLKLKILSYVDVKIRFLPKFVLNYIARQFTSQVFGNLQKLSENFENTVYAKVNFLETEFYEKLYKRLQCLESLDGSE